MQGKLQSVIGRERHNSRYCTEHIWLQTVSLNVEKMFLLHVSNVKLRLVISPTVSGLVLKYWSDVLSEINKL